MSTHACQHPPTQPHVLVSLDLGEACRGEARPSRAACRGLGGPAGTHGGPGRDQGPHRSVHLEMLGGVQITAFSGDMHAGNELGGRMH